jgi:hypothetical protein
MAASTSAMSLVSIWAPRLRNEIMTVNLIGTWVVDKSDIRALSELGDVSMAFGQDGSLNYVVRLQDRKQIIKLQYRVDGDVIVTDQPSAPNVERTAFSLSDDEVLTLSFGGVPYRFIRERTSE